MSAVNFDSSTKIVRYGGAVVFVFIATIITLLIWFLIKPRDSYLFMGAVIVSTWWGGFRVGVFSVILSVLAIDFVFIPPEFEFTLFKQNVFRLILFVIQGLLFCWLIEKNRQISEENRIARKNLQSLSLRQQTLLEAERKRIALEIHDELGQALTSMKMDIHQIKQNFDQAQSSEKLDVLSRLIDSTISKVRKIATDLRPPILDDFGTLAAIEWQAEEFEKSTGITCVFNSNVEDCELDSEVSIAVFRIFQEAMTNIVRHAEASTVEIDFEVTPEKNTMRVTDDGKGIDLKSIKSGESLGILGMHERARLIGGELKIYRAEGSGTTVHLEFPNLAK